MSFNVIKDSEAVRTTSPHLSSLTHSSESLRWPEEQLPLNIVAPESMRSELEDILASSCDVWNKGAKKLLLIYSFENYDPARSSKMIEDDGKQRIYFTKSWGNVSDEDGQLAITLRNRLGVDIKKTSIVFNFNHDYHIRPQDQNDLPEEYQYDLETVLIHELGHLLGLQHSDEAGSVMKPAIINGEISRTLSTQDSRKIFNKYH
jgi:hypothetical protein